jgi:glycosyltransferase involved in cell wall biosynthesis
VARIIHVCPRYLPARGGVELFFAKISEELAAAGNDVSVWTTDAATVRGFTQPDGPRLAPGPERIGGVEVRRFPVRYAPGARLVRTLANALPFGTRWKADTLRWTPFVPALTQAASRPDAPVALVHAAGLPYSSVLFAGVRLAERAPAALVVTPFTHVPPPGSPASLFRRAYLSPLNLRLIARADRVCVQTALERRVLQENGIAPERLVEVGQGVDVEACTGGDRARGRHRWTLNPTDVVVGHLANKSWDKGTVDLLDACEALRARGASFRLVLAGTEMPSFTERWARVTAREQIVNLGPLSDEERRDFYAAIDVFALPSYVESFGVSPLEAALNGAAVLAYNLGGPGELFEHDVSARLVEPGDMDGLAANLELLVRDAGTRTRLARGAASVAAAHTWPRVLEALARVYAEARRAHSRS